MLATILSCSASAFVRLSPLVAGGGRVEVEKATDFEGFGVDFVGETGGAKATDLDVFCFVIVFGTDDGGGTGASKNEKSADAQGSTVPFVTGKAVAFDGTGAT